MGRAGIVEKLQYIMYSIWSVRQMVRLITGVSLEEQDPEGGVISTPPPSGPHCLNLPPTLEVAPQPVAFVVAPYHTVVVPSLLSCLARLGPPLKWPPGLCS